MSPVGADFDPYADRYEELVQQSISFSGRERGFFLEAKARCLLDLVQRRLGDPTALRALDVGCGDGRLDSYLGRLGRLEGVDRSAPLVEQARRRNGDFEYRVADGAQLPFETGAFDLTFTVCVLHHVPPEERAAFVAELGRVTRAGGLVVVLEHNPLNPLTRLAVARCPFDADAVLLGRREAVRRLRAADLDPVEARYFLFLPFRARLVAAVERMLAPVPLGAQYYVAAHA